MFLLQLACACYLPSSCGSRQHHSCVPQQLHDPTWLTCSAAVIVRWYPGVLGRSHMQPLELLLLVQMHNLHHQSY
jgi:hypothetical protein